MHQPVSRSIIDSFVELEKNLKTKKGEKYTMIWKKKKKFTCKIECAPKWREKNYTQAKSIDSAKYE